MCASSNILASVQRKVQGKNKQWIHASLLTSSFRVLHVCSIILTKLKTESVRGTAWYWHHLITKTPVIHLQRINRKRAPFERLLKASEAMQVVTGGKKLHVTADNQSLYLMAFNFRRNTAYRWQHWNVRRSEGNISIPCVSRITWLTWSRSHGAAALNMKNSEQRCYFH